ncbi:MAG TPA: asparagine synthase (glutamine-hydrolyzing) [Burkholderiales bacterium]|nr:asparagine synthase (glutamine-hydrolyzing) [Burkholderiales bacterium]
MCGLAGWTSTGAGAEPGALAPMVEALSHRNGADESLSAVIDRQARRAVVLAASLCDESSGISIALDGPLVNAAELRADLVKRGYAFAGESDAEVVLRAYQHWDKDVVKHMRGGFALALWDAAKERLMLARDRFGQKPLYLCAAGSTLYFASEMKALVRAPGVTVKVDVDAVGEYLAQRYVRGPRTLLQGVRKLVPGTYALWQFGNLRETKYWSAPDGQASVEQNPADSVDAFIAQLDDAVKLHMASGAGALLSGGYDSAAIVALMSRHSKNVATFSAEFADDKHSELAAAARLAKHFGTQHHEIVLAKRDVLAQLPQLVVARDAPFCRPADVALFLLAREAARHVKVALSGDGGDEILGGYRRHTFLRGLKSGKSKANGLYVIPVADLDADPTPDAQSSALRRILYYEQTGWLADNLLERTDRMGAVAALEMRTPFLDHRVAEYVSTLPDAARVRGLSTKWILRKADERLISDSTVKPRKAGFRIALADLMRGEMRELVADHLRGPGCITRSYYDGAVLDRMLDEHFAVRRNHEETLWTLLNLEIWHRTLSAIPHSAARG